jgi:hypothetical protein
LVLRHAMKLALLLVVPVAQMVLDSEWTELV